MPPVPPKNKPSCSVPSGPDTATPMDLQKKPVWEHRRVHPWVTERCSPFLPHLGFAHACAPRDAHKRDDPLAIAPCPALQGPARGLEQVSLSLPMPGHQLGLNFQLLQNKFPGGCTWSWHRAEMPACLTSAVSVWGAVGMVVGLSQACHGLGEASCCCLQDRSC